MQTHILVHIISFITLRITAPLHCTRYSALMLGAGFITALFLGFPYTTHYQMLSHKILIYFFFVSLFLFTMACLFITLSSSMTSQSSNLNIPVRYYSPNLCSSDVSGSSEPCVYSVPLSRTLPFDRHLYLPHHHQCQLLHLLKFKLIQFYFLR